MMHLLTDPGSWIALLTLSVPLRVAIVGTGMMPLMRH